MMDMLEGRRLNTKLSADPLETKEYARHTRRATKASNRLRDAIWRLQGYTPPVISTRQPEICPSCMAPVGAPRQLIATIQQTVAAYYSLKPNAMTSNDRRREISHARQVAMYLASELTNHSIAEIGRRFKRDHTTVLHAIKAVNSRASSNHQEAFDVSLLREKLAA